MAILFLAFGTDFALGQDTQGNEFNLKKCIDLALEQSPALHSADQSVLGAEWEKKKAITGFLPTVSAQYSYTKLDETPMTTTALGTVITTIPQVITGNTFQVGTRDNYQLSATVSQPVFTGLALLSQYELSRLGLDVAQISREQARLDLIMQVKQAYYGVLQAEKGLDVTAQSVKQLQAHLEVAQSFYEVGMVPKNQVLQAEVTLAQAVQDQTVAENRLLYARASLNTLLRRPLDAPLMIEDMLCQRPLDHTVDESVAVGLEKRPEVRAAKSQIDMSGQNVRLARSGLFPTVAVQYNYTTQGDSWEVDGSDYMSDPDSWSVSAVASWDIWQWGRTYDEVQISKTNQNKAKNTLVQVEDAVRLEVKKSYLDLQAANKNIGVAAKAVEQAEENYRMSEERYREQVATSTEVTDAQTLLTSARTNYYAALYQFCLAWASLERAMGVEG
jgi:outer membrane protein